MLRLMIQVIFLVFVGAALSCSFDDNVNLASESVYEKRVFCAPFNQGSFEGILHVEVPTGAHSYNSNSAVLSFSRIPVEFRSRPNTYIQLRSINYSKDKSAQISDSPHTMRVFNRRTGNLSQIIDFIDHEVIEEKDLTLREFFTDFDFRVMDTAGRQALIIYLYNVDDNPLEKTAVLIPPFDANPFLYQKTVSNEKLVTLHPFYELMNGNNEEDDDIFISKAEDACQSV